MHCLKRKQEKHDDCTEDFTQINNKSETHTHTATEREREIDELT